MGEIKNRGREKVEDNQKKFLEVDDVAAELLDSRNHNKAIVEETTGVDDDDKAALETAKEVAAGLSREAAEMQVDAPSMALGEDMDRGVTEMNEHAATEKDDASKVSAMDGLYGGVGSSLENQFTGSAEEFEGIAASGNSIKEDSSAKIEEKSKMTKEEW